MARICKPSDVMHKEQRGHASLWRMAAGAVLALGFAGAAYQPAQALPSFARQTGQTCATCHTAFLQLTPFGRRFKLLGYTTTGGKYEPPEYPPLAGMLQSGFMHFNKDNPGQGPGFGPNNITDLALQASIFYGGKITDHLGAFMQFTVGNGPDVPAFGGDNVDIRYADTAKISGHDVIWGLDANNAPQVEDVWNTTTAWAWPFIDTGDFGPLNGPTASNILGLVGPFNILGGGGYVFVDDSYYAELMLYGSPGTRVQTIFGDCCGADILGNNFAFSGPAPYWRLAVEKNYGPHSIEFGTYGMLASTYPGNDRSFGATDNYWDEGFDSQYQWIEDKNAVTLRANYVWEQEQWGWSHPAANPNGGLTSNRTDYLNTLSLSGEYVYDNTYSIGAGYFNTWGTSDAGIYIGANGDATASPNSQYFVFDIAWLPFSHGGPSIWPWFNTRIGLSYTMYTEINGRTSNVDGAGSSASDSNTLFLYAFTMF